MLSNSDAGLSRLKELLSKVLLSDLQLREIPVRLEAKTLRLFLPVVFFPDFPRPLSDFFFVRPRYRAGLLFEFFYERQYSLDRLPIADPACEVLVLVGLL